MAKATVTVVSPPSRPVPPAAPNGGQYFAERPAASSRPGRVELTLPDVHLRLDTDAGVFSPGRVDPGTKLLLTELPPATEWPEGDVADVGCGYGAIAVTLARRLADSTTGAADGGDRTVWAVDVNERARDLCRRNAAGSGVGELVRVVGPEDLPPGLSVGLIASNPPIRVGKSVLHDLCRSWMERLEPDGEAWWVVQKHLGSDSLQAWMNAQGWPTERVRSRQAYRILRSTHPG